MVLEALTAIGLAGNITQFIDFTSKLFDTATKIYLSHEGSARDSRNLEDITQNLQHICADLSKSSQDVQGRGLVTQTIRAPLAKLATDCEAAAHELLSVLNHLRVKKPGSKWSSFKAALATIWKERQVNAMEKRLEAYRSHLIFELQILHRYVTSRSVPVYHVLKCISGGWREVKALIDDMYDQNRRLGVDLEARISEVASEVESALDKLSIDLETMMSTKAKKQRTSKQPQDVEEEGNRFLQITHLVWKEIVDSNVPVLLAVLGSLTFDQMDFRHSKIQEAHPNTFSWMFSNHFQPWLQSPEPIYWISGKPGSGKSTLMKYLVDNSQTPIQLRQWSRSQKLVITSYFFWVNGTELQRSQEGLLQALLYEILRQCPDLVETIVPDAWRAIRAAMANHTTPKFTWTRTVLLGAFEILSSLDRINTAFCVFIDGLDEYKGDHDNLIHTIQYLSRLNVKMCVASRPWNIFRDAYGQNPNCRLYLEDLNKQDIGRYVLDCLGARADFQELRQGNAQAAEILEEIVQKSQGVFLWVYLVVRSLIEGLRNEDRLSQLHDRLRSFPSDLEDFFRYIFQSLDTFYRKQLAYMFQITLVRLEPLSPLTYWYLDEQEENPVMALEMPIQAMTSQQIYSQMMKISRCINGRCKGLLEVTPTISKGSYNSRVDFLHRTVKDFFMTADMQAILKENQGKAFDADLAICKALLAELKSTATMDTRGAPLIYRPLHCFFYAAYSLEKAQKDAHIAYLDELERTVDEHVRSGPRKSLGYPWIDFG